MSLEAEKLYRPAVQLMQQGRFAEAAGSLLELARQHPAFAPAQARLGDLFAGELNDPASAEDHYQRALAADASAADAHTGYAALLIRLERFAEANAHLNKAANLAGARKDLVHQQIGRLQEAQVHLDDAAASYKKAILATFSDELLAACEKAIARCAAKKKYV
jgi:tetratricopeptide (TPR) repeat protein